ncbi:terpene synthase family protein [Nocardia rhamnosiphila]
MTYTLDDLDGVDLRLPDVRPARLNPDYEKVRPAYLDWLDSARTLAPEIDDAAKLLNYLRITSAWWPDAPARTLLDLSVLVTIFFLRDDAVDADNYRRAPEIIPPAIEDCRSRHTTANDPVWGPMLADVWADISRYTSPVVLHRVLACEEELLSGCLEAHDRHAHGQGYADLNDFFRLRIVTFGCPVTLAFTEIANGSDYTGLIDHPAARELIRCDGERYLLYDGLASIRKEIAQGNAEDNIITVIAGLDGISLRRAVETVEVMWDEITVRHRALGLGLLAGPLGSHPHAAELLKSMEDVITGSIGVVAPSPRYSRGPLGKDG